MANMAKGRELDSKRLVLPVGLAVNLKIILRENCLGLTSSLERGIRIELDPLKINEEGKLPQPETLPGPEPKVQFFT
jgi:hypothetical protein